MARNYEKRYTGLNRFLEAKQKEERGEEEQSRPPLSKLYSAEDVKKWIPSIQREIEYLLQQLSAPHKSRNYSDAKIQEFKERIELLKTEHKNFVSKVQMLDPSYKGTIPWKNRGYTRKRSHDQHKESHDQHRESHDQGSGHKKLCSLLLEKEETEKKEKMMADLAEKAALQPALLVTYSDSEASSGEG